MKRRSLDVFRGNMLFATHNQFSFKSTSRKDDLLSLCYLLVYLFHGGNVPFFIKDSKQTKIEIFQKVAKIKKHMTPEKLVGD
jgi:hypothetical protein